MISAFSLYLADLLTIHCFFLDTHNVQGGATLTDFPFSQVSFKLHRHIPYSRLRILYFQPFLFSSFD